ncbi:TPA: hypothetical protein ACIIJ9_005163, partial [Salmonella enterica subsp. enterica serovar Typhimurium]
FLHFPMLASFSTEKLALLNRFSVNTIGLHIASSIRHPIISMLRARTCRKISGKGQIQKVVITTSTT